MFLLLFSDKYFCQEKGCLYQFVSYKDFSYTELISMDFYEKRHRTIVFCFFQAYFAFMNSSYVHKVLYMEMPMRKTFRISLSKDSIIQQ